MQTVQRPEATERWDGVHDDNNGGGGGGLDGPDDEDDDEVAGKTTEPLGWVCGCLCV